MQISIASPRNKLPKDIVLWKLGLESLRPTGENWTEGDFVKPFISKTLGKLINRLIDSWEDRKKEAEDCLTWYNDQIIKCDKEIESLRLMETELTQSLPEEE